MARTEGKLAPRTTASAAAGTGKREHRTLGMGGRKPRTLLGEKAEKWGVMARGLG